MRLLNWTLAATVAAFALCAPAYADIGPKPRQTAPGVELTGKDYEGINVEMTSEDVQLVLSRPDKKSDLSLEVQVTFHMTNLGEATSFEIGFPVGAVMNMEEFSTTTDGKAHDFELIDRNAKGDKKVSKEKAREWDESGRKDYWYVWTASFAAKTTQVHVVKYKLGIWHWSHWRHPGYILHTGAAWKNPIKKATVTLRCEGIVSLDNIYEFAPSQGCTIHKDRVEWLFENFEPTEKHNIRLDVNTQRTWDKNISIVREEAQKWWSSKCELAYLLKRAPARNGRDKFNEVELDAYLDALAGVISELKEGDGKWVMPQFDPPKVYYGEEEDLTDEIKALRKYMEEMDKDRQENRSYANKHEANQLLRWFDTALETAKAYPESAKAKEVLGRYEEMIGHFLDGKLYAGAVKLELTHKSAGKRLAELTSRREEARQMLKLASLANVK